MTNTVKILTEKVLTGNSEVNIRLDLDEALGGAIEIRCRLIGESWMETTCTRLSAENLTQVGLLAFCDLADRLVWSGCKDKVKQMVADSESVE